MGLDGLHHAGVAGGQVLDVHDPGQKVIEVATRSSAFRTPALPPL